MTTPKLETTSGGESVFICEFFDSLRFPLFVVFFCPFNCFFFLWFTENIPAVCEYGMYDHSDTSNAYLLSEGWVPLTFSELSGAYKDDFIEYYNANDGLYSLLTWSSTNCCFAYGELTDTRLTMTTGIAGTCHVYPAIGTTTQCNPGGGYPQGTKYNFRSYGSCHNGQSYVTHITGNNVTFGTTSWCSEGNNPGIWRRCGNSTLNATGALFCCVSINIHQHSYLMCFFVWFFLCFFACSSSYNCNLNNYNPKNNSLHYKYVLYFVNHMF